MCRKIPLVRSHNTNHKHAPMLEPGTAQKFILCVQLLVHYIQRNHCLFESNIGCCHRYNISTTSAQHRHNTGTTSAQHRHNIGTRPIHRFDERKKMSSQKNFFIARWRFLMFFHSKGRRKNLFVTKEKILA